MNDEATRVVGRVTPAADPPDGPDGLTPTWVPAAAGEPTPPPAAWSVGRFRVERELGRGGMGVVLLAHDRDLNRPVAVKLLRDDHPEVLARFRLEAHALAGLAHPNAVRVYETGEHAGRPFLVLEYVPGQTLHDALRAGPLAPRRAAGLLARVAGAVHAAHALGVVHRDLKPANVLLDAADVPKLTDFGIARRLDGSAGLTATNEAVGTPGYMAPEQAAGKAPDARTDVYGLGATLYECLTGRPPFVGPTAAVMAQVLTADPVAPRRLNAGVPADLETVCLKCLHKDPARRYATAADLAADLDRVVRGEPVRARPTGRVEKAARWTRRNKLTAALAAAAVLSLVGGATAAGWQAVQATHARDAEAEQRKVADKKTAEAEERAAEAERERANARVEKQAAQDTAAELKAINTFLLTDLLGQASSDAQAEAQHTPNPGLTVRAAVDRAAVKVGERFHDRPAIELTVRQTLGGAYNGVGEYTQAVEQYRQVVRLAVAQLGPNHVDVAEARRKLASTLQSAGRLDEARVAYEEALAATRAALGPIHPETISQIVNLGKVHEDAGRSADALARHEEVIRLAASHGGPLHPDMRPALYGVAAAYRNARRDAEALPLYLEIRRMRLAEGGPESPPAVEATRALAALYHDMGRLGEAIPLQEEALRQTRAIYGPTHPRVVTLSGHLALGYRLTGRFAEATPLMEECLRGNRAAFGPDSRKTLLAMKNLAALYHDAGRPAEAVSFQEPFRTGITALLGPDHKITRKAGLNLGQYLLGAGRPADALPLLARAYGDPAIAPADAAEGRGDLGECLKRLGRFAEAEPHLLAVHTYHAAKPDAAALERNGRNRLAELYAKWGNPAEAAKWRPEVAPPPRHAP